MSTAFRKGELVIRQHASYYAEYNGCLGVVQTGLIRTTATDMLKMEEKVMTGYCIKILNQDIRIEVVALPHQLRRLEEGSDGQSRE